MIYEVWIECDQYCVNYEDPRLSKETNNSVEAIKHSIMLRDNLHHTEIRIKEKF